jgi:hypothetical protein
MRCLHNAGMEGKSSQPVSRDLVKAVLEVRDHRHNETHSVMLAMFQALVAELVEQGTLIPGPLAERIARAQPHVAPDPHGTPARDMLDHVLRWLCSIEPGLPPAHPQRWTAQTWGTLEEG